MRSRGRMQTPRSDVAPAADPTPRPSWPSTWPAAWPIAWRPDSRVALLVAGDTLAFLLFAAIGRKSHQEAAGLATLGQIAWTATPFALGWFAIAPWVGAFRRAQTDAPAKMLARTELAWLVAWPVALLLRWALAADHQIPLSFALVVLIANALLLGSWRTTFALVALLMRSRPQ